jgi:V-type H+-transporting ATPase subunit a
MGLTAGFFETQIKKHDIHMREIPDEVDISHISAQSAHEIDVLEQNTKSNEDRLNQLLESKAVLEMRQAELIELRYVLRETSPFLEIVCTERTKLMQAHGRADEIRRSTEEQDILLIQAAVEEGRGDEPVDSHRSSLDIGFIAGVIPRSKAFLFEKILWRVLRGNLYV